jgi:hypothetical protein
MLLRIMQQAGVQACHMLLTAADSCALTASMPFVNLLIK